MALAWAAAKKDQNGLLQLTFLQNWAADPSCSFVRLIERQGCRTSQSVRGIWSYRTYGQILKAHGGDDEAAGALVTTAAASMPHPQDPQGKVPKLRLYLIFEALTMEKAEEGWQERVLEGEAEVDGAGAGDFAKAGSGPSNMAHALPAPGELGAPLLAIKKPAAPKRQKPAPDEKRQDAGQRHRQLLAAIGKLNGWGQQMSEGVGAGDPLDIAYDGKLNALRPRLEEAETKLAAAIKAFDKSPAEKEAMVAATTEGQSVLKAAAQDMKQIASHVSLTKAKKEKA